MLFPVLYEYGNLKDPAICVFLDDNAVQGARMVEDAAKGAAKKATSE